MPIEEQPQYIGIYIYWHI